MKKQTCRTCRKAKPFAQFWKQKSRASGYQSECKVCMRGRNTGWMRENAEHRRKVNAIAVTKCRRSKWENFALNAARYRAKMSGLEFTITLDNIVVPEFCPALGIRLTRNTGHGRGWLGKDSSPSIDRVDNSKGYTPENIVIVSFRANRIKSDASAAELRKVADFYEKRRRSDARRARESELPPAGLFGQQNIPMPRVQPHPEKETGPVPIGAG